MDEAALASETIAYARELRALYRAAERRAVRFRLLVEMGRDLAGTHDPAALLRLALLRATTFSGYDTGAVLLVDPDGEVRVHAALDLGAPERAPAVAPVVPQQARLALAGGRAIQCADGPGPPAGDEPAPPHERLLLPLLPAEGRPLGVLMLAGSPPAGAPDADDLDALQLLAAQLAAALQSAQLHEQQEQLVRQLSEREQRLAELVDQLMRAQEQERRRVAYELHDGLSQMVLGVLQQIHILADSYRPRSPRARQALARGVEMGRAAVAEARRVIAGLRPSVLDDFGLAQAIQLQVETLRREGWEVQYEESLGATALTPAQETALFRIVQEALHNVRKHAGVTRVRVALGERENSITLVVQDWGRGFAGDAQARAAEADGGVGLASIGERVKLFGGQWQVQSQPGAGTLLEVSLPRGPAPGV